MRIVLYTSSPSWPSTWTPQLWKYGATPGDCWRPQLLNVQVYSRRPCAIFICFNVWQKKLTQLTVNDKTNQTSKFRTCGDGAVSSAIVQDAAFCVISDAVQILHNPQLRLQKWKQSQIKTIAKQNESVPTCNMLMITIPERQIRTNYTVIISSWAFNRDARKLLCTAKHHNVSAKCNKNRRFYTQKQILTNIKTYTRNSSPGGRSGCYIVKKYYFWSLVTYTKIM